jgi:hypothetical protein
MMDIEERICNMGLLVQHQLLNHCFLFFNDFHLVTLVVNFKQPLGQAITQQSHPTQRYVVTGFPSLAKLMMSMPILHASLHLPHWMH